MPDETDVLIVGGGPAGLATAIALGQRGLKCVVADARAGGGIGIDKPCGEGLMPDTVEALGRLGVWVDVAEGHAFRGIRFQNASQRAEARFPVGSGMGVRRPVLHQKLVRRAEATGAELRWGTRITFEDEKSARVNGDLVRFRYLVGADGQSSGVRKWTGLEETSAMGKRLGFCQHFQVTPWSDFVEIHWGRSGQVYVTPVGTDQVCVVFIARDAAGLDRADLFAGFPEIQRRLKGVESVAGVRGGVSTTRKLRRVATEQVALVGDASGSADSITGEGLAMCFRQSMALAEAIEAGDLKRYEVAHEQIGKLPHAMGSMMLLLDRWPVLEGRVIGALATHPALFAEMLAVHVGEMSVARFVLRRGPQLGWNLLTHSARA